VFNSNFLRVEGREGEGEGGGLPMLGILLGSDRNVHVKLTSPFCLCESNLNLPGLEVSDSSERAKSDSGNLTQWGLAAQPPNQGSAFHDRHS